MATATEAPEEAEMKRRPQVNLSLSTDEEEELIRRAGELQATRGKKTTVQDYIRSQLFGNVEDVAA